MVSLQITVGIYLFKRSSRNQNIANLLFKNSVIHLDVKHRWQKGVIQKQINAYMNRPQNSCSHT